MNCRPNPAKLNKFGLFRNNTDDKVKSRVRIALLSLAGILGAASILAAANSNLFVPFYQEFSDQNGRFANLNLGGPTDTTRNPFFLDIGTNGRRCVTCHQASDAWSVTPPHIQSRFEASDGTDPIFRPNDGSGCPTQDVSTVEARRNAYSLLLNKGLIRV